MASNSLAGDRRWGSGRRGGMTVLGKVAVPKPLNLPSQRLENHGLDPNVEIVPKGTLSWGTRTSSSSTNAWGSSSLSPRADGSANSPTHLSGRPSSGGSGTRPSTSGSDRQVESTGNAWGPNSRPSSASGAFASNQSSTISLRPRSAETRPASSQLSRFAEPQLSDSPIAWGTSGTADRLGVISSKRDDFSLSSGDFPSLGSDRDIPGKRMESKDPGSHSRPTSASGREAQTKDKPLPSHADDVGGPINTWRKDGSQSIGDGIPPSIEKWQGDPQQYFNPNVPQHFDAWRGPPPMNAPGGVWYRGPPGGPPYGAPVAPGGFPMELFPYFRPQIPPPAFANSQPVPPPRGGHRAHHPKGGNAYRPQTPDPYVHPGMPFRPGFYPPPMAFDGYYGRPMGYCNSNERDVPFMGMGAGPVYERCSGPNAPNSGDSHARAGGPAPSGKPVSDHVESVYSGDARGPYKDLKKQQNEWDEKAYGENREHMQPNSILHPVKGQKAGIVPRKYEWGAEDDGDEDMYSLHDFDNEGGHVSVSAQPKSSQSSASMKPVDECLTKKPDSVTPFPSQVHQESISDGGDSALPSTVKGVSLMQKIEGLNAKVRAVDGRTDSAPGGEEQISDPNTVDAVVDSSSNKAARSLTSLEGNSLSGQSAPPPVVIFPARGRKSQPTVAMSRNPHHDLSSGTDPRGKKGKFGHQDADGWQRKPVIAELPDVGSASSFESSYDVQRRDTDQPVDAAGNNPPAKDEAELVAELPDSVDSQAQRAKIRELAKQRAIQLQKEEEERTREQKAKALAKLEELNRRMQSGDASNQTKKLLANEISKHSGGDIEEPIESVTKLESSNPVSHLETEVSVFKENSGNQVIVPEILSPSLPVEMSKAMKLESIPCQESGPSKQDANTSANDGKFAPQLSEGSGSRLKRTSYKQKQNTVPHKNVNDKSLAVDAGVAQKLPIDTSLTGGASSVVASSETGSINQSCMPNSSVIVSEPSAPQRRRSSKNIKEKNKKEDLPSVPTSLATMPGEAVPPKTTEENVKSQASSIVPSETVRPKTSEGSVKFQAALLDLNFGSIPATVYGETQAELLEQVSSLQSERVSSVQAEQVSSMQAEQVSSMQAEQVSSLQAEQVPSLQGEEAHGKASQWKPHLSRRAPRNQQSNRYVDKFHGGDAVVWAPVRTQNKAGNNSEATIGEQKLTTETITPAKPETLVQNSLKSKRAEMERYVPKPFAKELAQQSGLQIPHVSSVNTSAPDQTGIQQPVGSATGNSGPPVQSKEGFAKHNKQGKAHGAWRQRGSTEFSDAKNVQQVSSATSNPPSAQADEKTSSELNVFDSQVVSSNSDTIASDAYGFKDQGVAGKGSRHPHRGHRNVGNSHSNDNKNIRSAETERTHIRPVYDMNPSDRGMGPKETRGTGESMSSQWQPKSHANSASGQKGSKIAGSQDVGAEASRHNIKKDHPQQQRVKTPPERGQGSNERHGVQLDQNASENKVVAEVPKVGNHEPRRERKLTSSKGRPYSPNQNPTATDESSPPVGTDTQHERPFSAGGSRIHGNQHSRSSRGHDLRGEWSTQDNRQHNVHNRDRQRQNMHYEYQPVGSYNNTKNANFEGPADSSRNAGSRYRERGQSYPKRGGGGNFQGRQSRPLQVDAGGD